MNFILRKLLILVLVVGTFGVALAQEETPLKPNAPIQGEITARDEQDIYLYEGVAGETVEFSVTALEESSLDTVLELYDSSNNELAQNDDRAPNDSNSSITYTFVVDDTYRVVVRGYASIATGAYEIVATAAAPVDNNTTVSVIALDQPVSDTLEVGEFDVWDFVPAADGLYRISLESLNFDTQLRVLDASGVEIAYDDDSGTELNAFISRVELRTGETYTIEARSYLDEGAGAYDLSVTLSPEVPPSVSIKYGETIETELISGIETTLIFEGAANDIVSIRVSSEFDAYMEVLDSSGNIIAYDDDSGGELQPFIENLQLPTDGTYVIVVYGYNSYDAGTFNVTLNEVEVGELPTNQPITYGESVEGFLPTGQNVSYVFTGTAGDVVSVEVESGFDGYLELRDSTGSIIASDDDSGFDLNPLIENIELPDDGEYTLVLAGFGSDTAGSYTLTLTSDSSGPVANTETGTIAYGQTVEGEMVAREAIRYTFEGTEGDVISITVETPFDSYLELHNAVGDVLIADDDSGGQLQPAITDYTLPVTGTYELILSGFNSFDEGGYTISLTVGGIVAPEDVTPITYGETLTATMESGNKANFSFEGTEGDIVTISVAAPFDGLMELISESGELLATDDDGGGDLNPKIEGFTLPATGTYTIVISAFGGATGGEFTITLETGESGTTPENNTNIVPIEYGATVEGVLNGRAIYIFAAEAGDTITVAAEAEFDGLLEVVNSEGIILVSDDDSGTGLNPLIEGFVLEAAGEYLIVLTSFEQTTDGAYTLTLTAGDAAPTATVIEAGQTLTQPLVVEGATVFVFNGEAGQKISLVASPVALDSDLDLYIEVFAPNGELLAADDDSGWRVHPALNGVELPETGTYQINVQSFSGAAEAEFNLALESGALFISPGGEAAETLPLDNGQAVLTLNLDEGKTRLYTFEGTQGNILTITTSNPVIGVEVYNADGSDQVLENGELTIPVDGTYLLVAYALEAATGDVHVSLFDDVVIEPVKTAGGLVAPDSPIQDAIERGEQEQWTFAPVLTGNYTFVLTSEDESGKFDPYLVVLDTEGNLLAQDDDSGGNFGALISNFAIDGGTKIILEVRGFDNNSAGAYTLAVVTENLEEVTTLVGGELAVGDDVSDTLLPGQQAEFTLTIEDTSTLNITVDGLTLPYLDVYNEEDELVIRGAGAVKALELEAGTYQLVVYDRLNRAGNFSVQISAAATE